MRGTILKRWSLVAAVAILVSGCALPPVVTVASLAFDFASYGETGKTVTDHGISVVLQQDCALIRVFDGAVCREQPDENTPAGALAALHPLADPSATVADGDPMRLPPDLEYLDGLAGRALVRAPQSASNPGVARQAFAFDPLPFGGMLDAPANGSGPAGRDQLLGVAGYLSDGARPARPAAGRPGLIEAMYLSDGMAPG
ncbi:MAG: hypothetical protein ACE5GS_00240 [Kiloniellaceae bacterium]